MRIQVKQEFDKVDTEKIFIELYGDCNLNKARKSLLYLDNHPNCKLFVSDNQIMIRDFKLNKSWTAQAYYSEVMRIPYADTYNKFKNNKPKILRVTKNKILTVKLLKWSKEGLSFWNSIGVNPKIYPLKQIEGYYLDGEYIALNRLAFAYFYECDNNKECRIKIYCPKFSIKDTESQKTKELRKKFLGNHLSTDTWFFDYSDGEKSDTLIIHKSLKDQLCIESLLETKISSFHYQNESHLIYNLDIINKFKKIIIMFGSDAQGIKAASELRTELMKLGLCVTVFYPLVYTDFSDMCNGESIEKVGEYLNSKL